MSAHQHMKRMLDELMGTGRNGAVGPEKVCFHHQRVCKCFLLNCCPHDILSATRCDLGKCPKDHDFALRADYEAAIKTKDYDFNAEVLQQLKNFIIETERRGQIAKHRLVETQQSLTANESIRNVKVEALEGRIKDTLTKLEEQAKEGNVDESMTMMKTLEDLKAERSTLEKEYRIYVPNSKNQQQRLRICTTCASYLGFDDDDERLADHFNGRMHLGYLKIRKMIDDLENTIQEKHIRQFLDKEFKSTTSNFTSNTPSLQIWSGVLKANPPPSKSTEKRKLPEVKNTNDMKQLKVSPELGNAMEPPITQ